MRTAIVIIQNRKRGDEHLKNFEEIMSERKNRIEPRKDELIRGINPEKVPYFRNFLNNFS